jgi:hypothetical protein
MPFRTRKQPWYRRIPVKAGFQALFVAVLMYSMVYSLLSAAGRWGIAYDRVEWQPYGLAFYAGYPDNGHGFKIRGSFFGYVFAPMILLDRHALHQSLPADSREGQQRVRYTMGDTEPNDGDGSAGTRESRLVQ